MIERQASSQFQHSLSANLAFWTARVQGLQESQFHTLDPEAQNLTRAVSFGLKLASTREVSVQLILTLMDYIEWRGIWRVWIPLFERARILFPATHPLWGRLICRLGFLYRLNGQISPALEMHQEALAFAKSTGDEREEALAALGVADEYYLFHRYAEAEAYAQAGMAALLTNGETGSQLRAAYNLLGMISHARGAYTEAAAYYETALENWPQAKAFYKQAQTLTNYANTLRELGRSAEAITTLSQASVLLQESDSRFPLVFNQLTLGTVYFSIGDYGAALTAFKTIDLAFLRRYGYLSPQASVLNNLGNVYLALKQYAAAEEYLADAVEVWRTAGETVNLANTLGDLGEACFHQGFMAQANLHWNEALGMLAQHLSQHPEDAWAKRLERGIAARRDQAAGPRGHKEPGDQHPHSQEQ